MSEDALVTILTAFIVPIVTALLTTLGLVWKSNKAQKIEIKKLQSTAEENLAKRELEWEKAHDEHELAFQQHISKEIESLRARSDRLQERNEELVQQYAELHAKYKAMEQQLSTKIALFESAHQELPIPMWLKDPTGKVLSVNDAYEKVFLVPRGHTMEDYEGHYDTSVWPEDVAQEFARNDATVFKSGKTWLGQEGVPDEKGDIVQWNIVKYVRYAGPVKIGIAGIAFPEDLSGVL